MSLFARLHSSLRQHANNNAFFIADRFYSYNRFATEVAAIRSLLVTAEFEKIRTVAIVTNDDFGTYAAILACWFEGRTYVPLSPDAPRERRAEMIRLSATDIIFDSSGKLGRSVCGLEQNPGITDVIPFPQTRNVYILFTSGSTGSPKAVPITAANLAAFIDAVDAMEMDLTADDRWLQMFDLTFDLSVFSFLIPLLHGACIYTVPATGLKYQQIFRLLDEQQLTVALMVPSVLQFFRPYFEEIHFPALRNSLFCGEALPLDLAVQWQAAAPTAMVYNVYGPSEATIFCCSYFLPPAGNIKSLNDVVSIGKPMKGTVIKILDEPVPGPEEGSTGELCLAGGQITPGYLESPEKNAASFIPAVTNGTKHHFYKTGDLCFIDADGEIYFKGRTDTQIKIQGHRVELGEIDYYVRQFLPGRNVLTLSSVNNNSLRVIGVFIEGEPFPVAGVLEYLKEKIPGYMMPATVRFIPAFPLNSNGKTDRQLLQIKLSVL